MSTQDSGADPWELARPSDPYVFTLLMLAITALIVTLPLTLTSIRQELFGTQVAELYDFPSGDKTTVAEAEQLERIESFYNLTLTDIDEGSGSVTVAFSGNRQCQPGSCPKFNATLIAYNSDVVLRRGLPPTAVITIDENEVAFSDQVTLPVVGQPSLYPFDVYRLRLGVVLSEVRDGKTVYLPTDQVSGISYGTIQNATRDFIMKAPLPVSNEKALVASDPFTPTGVQDLSLRRPTYLRVLTITLVTLVTISSLLSLMSRAVSDALFGIGSLVLGVWGIRQVLVPSGMPVVTSVDISLSFVIMILLFGITIRSAGHLRRRSNIKLATARLRKR
jgi:hypothetical protein